ncbi:MAG TPA: 4,5-DOPA dioxygenase extradiol [Bacteroidia bacterium]|nr:4,5-DOPA dioxygenase extradiol [Bacteroidia bacterium]
MDRRKFITNSIMGIGAMTTLNSFVNLFNKEKFSEAIMPVLFVGHGNPMNAIEKNEYNTSWNALGKNLPKPKAILCVSAHWLTSGTKVTAMEQPKTIHDFGGFPDELFAQQYPAKGSPEFAKETQALITKTKVQSDFEWGLDHGTWSVLLPMFPQADIPVYQLSIDYSKPPQYHYELAKELAELRKRGVLIVGSGNIVHNLRMIDWNGKAFDWAIEFDEKIKKFIDEKNHNDIINYEKLGQLAQLAVPTNDHYLPLLYSLALQDKKDSVKYFNDKCEMGSISMRSLIIS